MTSTLPDGVVLRGLPAERIGTPERPADLRTGAWTRLGSAGALGDEPTERSLHGIAERSASAARAQGYAQGWAEGRRIALVRSAEEARAWRRTVELEQAQVRRDHERVVAALEDATAQLGVRMAEAVADIADQVVEAALAVAEAVVGRELQLASAPGADALRRALSSVDPVVTTTVRMNPDDRASLAPRDLPEGNVVLVDDPSLAPGDAVAETPHTLLDATIGSALDRVREVLSR